MHQADWSGRWGASSLMLLDFTPDNLFVDENALSFIDPWLQDVYLGHPAVSAGQFATLMQLYKMKDSAEATNMLEERCEIEMPLMLGCDIAAVKRAFCLGSTLQLVLSSYVRQESDPSRSAELIVKANELW